MFSLKYWLKNALKTYDTTLFLPFGKVDNDDLATCKLLSSCANFSQIITSKLSIETLVKVLSESSYVFPYRLHGLIFSYIAGAKYQFYPYHRKLTRVHNTIQDSNLTEIRQTQRERVKEALEVKN